MVDVCFGSIVLKNSVGDAPSWRERRGLLSFREPRGAKDLRKVSAHAFSYSYCASDSLFRAEPSSHSSQVLRRCGHQELIARAFEASKSQPIELQDAFLVREQHLDLLAVVA